jgi:hypothetical protein
MLKTQRPARLPKRDAKNGAGTLQNAQAPKQSLVKRSKAKQQGRRGWHQKRNGTPEQQRAAA